MTSIDSFVFYNMNKCNILLIKQYFSYKLKLTLFYFEHKSLFDYYKSKSFIYSWRTLFVYQTFKIVFCVVIIFEFLSIFTA